MACWEPRRRTQNRRLNFELTTSSACRHYLVCCESFSKCISCVFLQVFPPPPTWKRLWGHVCYRLGGRHGQALSMQIFDYWTTANSAWVCMWVMEKTRFRSLKPQGLDTVALSWLMCLFCNRTAQYWKKMHLQGWHPSRAVRLHWICQICHAEHEWTAHRM